MMSLALSPRAAVALAALLVGIGAVAAAPSNNAIRMRLTIEETHDRLTPTPKPGIVKRHEIQVVMGADKNIQETLENSDITRKLYADPGGSHATVLGENDGKAVWHVAGPNKLRRISQRDDQLMIIDLTTMGDRTCSIDVKYLIKDGRPFHDGFIAGTTIAATFTASKVVRATCEIE